MDLALVRFLSLTFTPALTGAVRPGLTFAVVQMLVGVLVHLNALTIAPEFAWLVSVPALVIGLVLGIAETFARHDPDFAALLRDMKIDHATGAFGAFSAALLFSSLGLPEVEAGQLMDPQLHPGADDVGVAVQLASASVQTTEMRTAAVIGAVGVNGGMTWARGHMMRFLDDLELSAMWARVETGGVLVALALLPLMPLLVVGLVALAAVSLLVVGLIVRVAERAADRMRRQPCDACGHAVRVEATCCSACGGAVEPTRLLAQPGQLRRGWRLAMAELRTSGDAPASP